MQDASIVFDTPFGTVSLTATDDGLSHVRLRSDGTTQGVKPVSGDTQEPEHADVPEVLRKARTQITEYLEGKRQSFDIELDMIGTEFQKDVWKATSAIPYGETRSYGEIAKHIGRPRSSRAVGGALHVNPLPLVIPCHRVIGKNGSLVGFGGGLDMKARLLDMENKKK